MCHCCGNHSESEKANKINFGEKAPKSVVGKFLNNLGKKESEKKSQDKTASNETLIKSSSL